MSKIARDLNIKNIEERVFELEKNPGGGISEVPLATDEAVGGFKTGNGVSLNEDGNIVLGYMPNEYDATKIYNAGSYVMHDGKIYQITKDGTTGDWSPYYKIENPFDNNITKNIIMSYNPTGSYDSVNKILTADMSQTIEDLKSGIVNMNFLTSKKTMNAWGNTASYGQNVDFITGIELNSAPTGIGSDTSYTVKLILGKAEYIVNETDYTVSKVDGIGFTGANFTEYFKGVIANEVTNRLNLAKPDISGVYEIHKSCNTNSVNTGKFSVKSRAVTDYERVSIPDSTDVKYVQENYVLIDIDNSNLKDFNDGTGRLYIRTLFESFYQIENYEYIPSNE